LAIAWRRLVALACLVASVSATTFADERRPVPLVEAISIESAPDECPADALVERVGQWLQRPSLDAGTSVRVQLGGEGGPAASFELLRDGEAPAVRTFDVLPGECAARLDALALAIAIAIDPAVMARIAEDEAGDASGPPATVTTDAEETTEAASESPPEPEMPAAAEESDDETPQRWQHAVSLGGTFGWRLIPDLSATATVAFRTVYDQRLVLRGGAWVSSRAEHSLGPGAFESRLFGGRVDGCARWALDPIGVDVCGGVLAGVLRAEGKGFAENLVTYRPWVALAVGVRGELPLGDRFALAANTEAVVPLLRPELTVSDEARTTTVRESVAPVAIQVALEALVRFP